MTANSRSFAYACALALLVFQSAPVARADEQAQMMFGGVYYSNGDSGVSMTGDFRKSTDKGKPTQWFILEPGVTFRIDLTTPNGDSSASEKIGQLSQALTGGCDGNNGNGKGGSCYGNQGNDKDHGHSVNPGGPTGGGTTGSSGGTTTGSSGGTTTGSSGGTTTGSSGGTTTGSSGGTTTGSSGGTNTGGGNNNNGQALKRREGPRIDLELTGVTLFRVHTSTAGPDQVFSDKEAREAMSGGATATYLGDVSCVDLLSNDFDQAKRARCFEGLDISNPSKPATWTAKQRADFARRTVPQFKIEAKNKVTSQTSVLSASAVYQDHPATDLRTIAARLTAMSSRIDADFTLAKDLHLDLCAFASAGVLLGRTEIQGDRSIGGFEARGGGCAGLKIGTVAELGYEFSGGIQANFDGSQVYKIEQSGTVKHIGGTPLIFGYTNERETTQNCRGGAMSIETHLFTGGFTWK